MRSLRPCVSTNSHIIVIMVLHTHSSGSTPIRTHCIVTAWELPRASHIIIFLPLPSLCLSCCNPQRLTLRSCDTVRKLLNTRLTGETQEWFYRNVEWFDHQVCEWTLETVAQGLQRRFLHTLIHHHASNKFDTVYQGTKTVQEVLNDLKKYAAWMIHLPDVYMFCKQFVSALRDSLCNEVLKKGYNAEFSTIDQLYGNCSYDWRSIPL